jgi:hypothetical protein
MRASGLNSTSINTLDTAFAETRPDGLRRIINYGGDILAFGETSVEVWRNTGNPTGFPFSYVDTIERGLLTQTALAGNEPGFAAGVMWLGDDGVIYQMQGYKAARVSTHTIERQIAAVADKTAFEALVYVHNGHSCWALSCNEWTWEYDFSTGAWYERKSYGRDRWRARRSAWWRDRWIVGDDLTGFLFTVDPNAKQEAGQPLTAIVTSATMSPFPRGARWNTLELDLMAGVGVAAGVSPVETAPVAMVAWSRDGGVTFGNPVHRPMGAQGEYTKRIRVNNLGLVSSQGAQVSVSVSDPVDFSLYSGEAAFAPLVT